ncbi:GNAT family N-acetyltransferase [Asticcacaulis sp. 201]|uniref:GNAT family N-acetyltransferase n=1 Tax=Asticcacaulis sp. 201 TaxID=3028787 RepID=UPI002916B7FC|nr:GNAT family N-acetyltransferase [Asticcacaulis sp. 201]MDV6330710.1 GNAT family N-acetyltransferase [Asticcacaulis sp. 201]
MLEARIFDNIASIDASDWNACFTRPVEDHAYHLAIEASGLVGFGFFYVTIFDGERLIGAAPAFTTPYDLETTLDNARLREMIAGWKKRAPGLLRVSLAALGSPCTEVAMLGIRDQGRAREIASLMLDTFFRVAKAKGGALLAVKDLAEHDRALWQPLIEAQGCGLVSGLPVARLPIDFATIDEYLSRLSHATRKDMRRKLKARTEVRLKRVSRIEGYEEAIMALYRDTRARAEMAFEELTLDYFNGVLARRPGGAFCALYLKDDRLLAANLLLRDDTTLIDKFFVMGAEGRANNLYFTSWFDNIAYCLDQGLTLFQVGQAAYANKLRLGAQLLRTDMAFRHRNPAISAGLKVLSPLFAADPVEEAA